MVTAAPDSTLFHLIGGEEVPSLSGETFPSCDPATGEQLCDVAFGRSEDVDRAVQAARRAFEAGVWVGLASAERAARLRRWADMMRDEAEELAEIESADSGKPLSAARGDVALAASLLDYASTLPQNVRGSVFAEQANYFAYSRREPYGVVGAIAPWNFPLLNAVWKTAPALAVGNSIVLKMAEQTPLTTSSYGRLALEAGIPAGVLNVVHGDGPCTGAALVAHPDVPKITFTGSTAVGREILISASAQIKSCHLELGGKSPNIVFADSDLDQAIDGSLFTSFFNSGQICTSGSRLLLQDSIADEFLDEFERRMAAIKVGHPRAADTQLGPVISGEQRDRIEQYVRGGLDDGATVRIGGERPAMSGDLANGFYVAPTLLADVHSKMTVAQDEIFGPVIAIIRFEREEDAVEVANDVMYGLAATVWTNDLARSLRLAERLRAGIIWTNCPHHLQWQVPYEGHAQSGVGEDLGLESIQTFTSLKVNYIHYGADHFNWA